MSTCSRPARDETRTVGIRTGPDLCSLICVYLFEYFEYDVKKAYNVTKAELEEVCGYYELSTPRNYIKLRDEIDIEKCFNQALEDKDMGIMTAKDDNYPSLLREIPDFPISLYYKGSFDGIDFKSAFVYGCIGLLKKSCALAFSTILIVPLKSFFIFNS